MAREILKIYSFPLNFYFSIFVDFCLFLFSFSAVTMAKSLIFSGLLVFKTVLAGDGVLSFSHIIRYNVNI